MFNSTGFFLVNLVWTSRISELGVLASDVRSTLVANSIAVQDKQNTGRGEFQGILASLRLPLWKCGCKNSKGFTYNTLSGLRNWNVESHIEKYRHRKKWSFLGV